MLLVTSYSLSFVLIINFILTFIIIFLERKDPQSTYAWLLLIWLIPALGFLFYLLFSQNIARRKIFHLYDEEMATTHKLLSQQKKDLMSNKIPFRETTRERYKDIVYFHQNLSNALYTNNNIIKIFTDGKEKFKDLFEKIDAAKDHIHMEYFIIKNDDLGLSLLALLMKKAREGVTVRLLFDDMGGRYLQKKDLEKLTEAGGKIGRFFPSRIKFFNLKANYRNHRKIVVIDGNIGYLGGFNVGNEYLGLKKNMGYWRDTHIRIIGGAVYELQMRFILDWRCATKENIQFSGKYLSHEISTGHIGVQIVSSGPDDINDQIKQGYIKIINSAKEYIYIQTPYFIPDQSIFEAIKIAAISGVDVRIMIPNKPDHLFVYWATFSYVGELLQYGARIFIYDVGFLHAKTIVSDDMLSSVGTCNFDIRSFVLNFEVNAFIYDETTAKSLKEIFHKDMFVCREITYKEYKTRSIIVKIKESISRLFSPVL
ncbi:MAG: cardiolipin synthase [Eubacteriales bacterium]